MREVYLDHAASTPVDPRVVDALSPYFREQFGNPSSLHRKGIEAERGINVARAEIARAVGVEPAQVFFTSGGTESNAIGILGAPARGRAAVASAIEHPSALGSARMRAGDGLRVIDISPRGTVDVEAFAAACDHEVAVATCMLVSNELGTVQPVREITERLRARGFRGHFHVDAVQALGKLPLSLPELGADSIALSSHKLHGPKGVGALVVRSGVSLRPLWGGGKHEGGLRPGTENAPGIVGFGRAAALATAALAEGAGARMAALRDLLVAKVMAAVPGVRESCPGAPRAPHIASLVFPNLEAEVLVHALEARGVYASAGAACASRDKTPSHVARALGLSVRDGMLRLSLARISTEEDIEIAAACIPEAVKAARP